MDPTNDTSAERISFADLPDPSTPDEVRRCLPLSRTAVYEAIRTGDIPSVRIGRRILIPKSALAQRLGITDTPGGAQ